ncbi:MAG: WXG100 family type VII secretion target [Anaerolineales bacterium]
MRTIAALNFIQILKGGTMPSIQITPENVQKTGTDIKAKKAEVDQIIQKGKTLMDGLRGEFKGHLAGQIFSKWDELLPKLQKSTEVLEEAGQLLQKASDAFSQVDNQNIR